MAKSEQHNGRRFPSMYSSALKCAWSRWSVVDAGILRLDMPEHQVCSMEGAIKQAEALCPMVWRIDTYSNGKPDTMYIFRNNQWQPVGNKQRLLYRCYPAKEA